MAEPNTILPPTYAPAYSLQLDEEPLEGRLIAAIARVLGLDRESISLLDSFVELGGEEEDALRLQKVCVDAGMAVKTKDILRCQTVAELQTCVTPCAQRPAHFDCSEPIAIAPLEFHKAKRSRPRQSSDLGGSTNSQPETELEEVLSRHSLVSHVTATNPKAGMLEGKHVVIMTLHNIKPVSDHPADISVVSPSQMLIATTQIATLKGFVERSLSAMSLPDVWIVLNTMPLTESGDVNRRLLRTWAQNINEDTYRQVMHLADQHVLQAPSTDMERSVQRAVGKVLQVPQDHIGMNFMLSQLGFDELSAIELVARCKQQSIHINADEALQNTTLADLAHTAFQRMGHEENSDSFDLSPIQRLYFLTPLGGCLRRRTMSNAGYRFNQSHLLRITKPCVVDDIQAAIEAVVGHHPMLRCRFWTQDGKWLQKILPDVPGSYAFSHHTVSSDDEVKAVIERSQAAIDIQNGPVFSVDYLQTHDGQQMIYLNAHHLAVDLPSWRIIIHDMDELLDSGSLLSQRSMPYRKWIERHKVAALKLGTDASILPKALLNQSYWQLKDVPNSYEDAVETSFSLSSELTSVLQGTCNHVFQTDAADIYLACLMLSFAQTFIDRVVPIIWIQEPGRASLGPEMDFSETVGWFTSLTPLMNKVSSQDNIVEVLRRLKDSRRISSVSGSLQFASKLYGPGSEDAFPLDDQFEVVFSYAGCLDKIQRTNGVLEQVSIPGRTLASRTSDVGPTVGRISAFEVTAVVEAGIAKVNFVYNRYSKQQERISSWISNCEHLLLESISRLRYHAQELTLSDVPYLDITYAGLDKLNRNCINTLKLSSVRDVEAVYPVTASQQRILICQAQRPESNIIRSIVEFITPTGEMIDTSRLCLAWQLVAARHAALRTVFQESGTETGLYDQIVLRRVFPDMLFIDTAPPDDPIDELSSLPNIDMMDTKPAHRLTLCKTPIKTLLSLEISAAICDAASIDILLRDLWHTYSTQRPISASVRFSYADYIEMLKTTRQGRSLKYWTNLLATTRPCLFPSLTSRTVDGQSAHVHVELEVDELETYARSQGVSNEAVVRLAWALVLRSFVGDNYTCFGCSTSGRERLVDGLSEAVGSFASTVPFAVRLLPLETVASSLRGVDEQLKSSLLHQFVAIPEIEHALALNGGTHLFNTWLSYSEGCPSLHNDLSGSLELKSVSQQHCTSYDISLHLRHLNGRLVLDASSRMLPEKQALNVANAFGVAIQAILSSVDSSIRDISLFSDRDYAQIVAWGNDRTDDLGRRDATVVHELVTRHAFHNPGSQAVCAWDGDFSYQQMVDAATTLAHYLVDSGVGPHAVVPLVLEKSRWAPVAVLAVLITGAAFVPIDAEELDSVQSIFDQLDAKVAVTAEVGQVVLGNLFDRVIVLNDSLFLQMPQYKESLPSIATPDDTACILFSPTSTKDTRGIAFTHDALSIAFLAQGPAIRITAKSRVMQLSSFNSDIALSEIFTTLAHGGCVCIPSSTQRLQNYTVDVQRMQVNWSYMTPFLSRKLDPTLLPTLRVVCFRTRRLDEDTYSTWAGKVDVVLAYGAPRVCPLGISFLSVVGPSDLNSIGRPIAGKFWIVNPDDPRKLMPVGAVGELVIEGPTLGSNYPHEDAGHDPCEELEVPDGRSGIKTKYFKTGHHQVRYLEEGTMQFISSERDDLEIGDRTVDLTEIEMHIRRCLGHGVDVTVETITFPGAKDVPVLVAFIGLGERLLTGRDDLVHPSPAIRETVHMVKQLVQSGLKNVVAPRSIPSVIIPVTTLVPALQVDRQGLKQLVQGLSMEQLEGLAIAPPPTTVHAIDLKPLPLTHAEESVRGILARVLSVDPAVIGSDDGFFDIGGDEVLAAKFLVACRHEGLALSIADILRNATLTALCRSMTTTDESMLPEPYSPVELVQAAPQPRGSTTEAFIEKVLAPKLGVERRDIKEVADTSAMQTRYIESGMLRGRANIDYFTFVFLECINGVRLEEACRMLPIIHPILRTAFTPHNRRVWQAVIKSFSVEFVRHSCPSWKLPSMTKKVISKDQMAPIAFNKPITRFMLVDGGKQATLILRLSKAQYDDLSIALLVKDLKRLYDNIDNPPRRPSYCDFIKSIQNGNCDETQRYWQNLLEGTTMTQVVEHGKPVRLTTHVKTVRQKLLVGSLSNLGISFETVLKSAWAMVLASLSATSDVVFGEIVNGRHVRLQGGHSVLSVMGPTANVIPVRIQFPDTPLTPLELLQYVHKQRIAGIPFENMGFLEVVERCTHWPYWTRLSTVVQHQDADITIIPGEPKTFHLGSTPCILDVVESRARDLHDFFVHSITRGQGKVELGLTFSTDRIPEDFAEYALRLLCDNVSMFTSGSIMLSIIPSARQYQAMQKRIPLLPTPTPSDEPRIAATPMQEIEQRTLSSFIPPDQARAIQTVISTTWNVILNPRDLGVPDEHIHRAAFYDLWGSLIPAAQLAAQLNRTLPKLGLPGLDNSAPILSMEEIVDHPTMHKQFELIAAKMATGQAKPLLQKNRSRSVSAAEAGEDSHTARKPSGPVASSAATVVKNLRRLASTVTRSSAPPATAPETATLRPGFRAPEISPLTPAPQLPRLPIFSPVVPYVFNVVPVDGVTAQPNGTPSNMSSARSMTTGSTASSARSDEGEQGESTDVLGPLRSEVAARVRLQTQKLGRKEGVEDVVSPLSAASGGSVRLWEGSGGLGADGASAEKRRGFGASQGVLGGSGVEL